MRNCDRSAYYQSDIECVHELCARDSGFGALFEVISDAIITTQDDRRSQSHQLLCPFVERAVFIRLRVEGKESLNSEVIAAQQLFIHCRAIVIKVVHRMIPFQGSRMYHRPARYRITALKRLTVIRWPCLHPASRSE